MSAKVKQDVAAFKAAMQRQDFTSWHSKKASGSSSAGAPGTPQGEPGAGLAIAGEDAGEEGSGTVGGKRKRPKTSAYWISFDQPLRSGLLLWEVVRVHD